MADDRRPPSRAFHHPASTTVTASLRPLATICSTPAPATGGCSWMVRRSFTRSVASVACHRRRKQERTLRRSALLSCRSTARSRCGCFSVSSPCHDLSAAQRDGKYHPVPGLLRELCPSPDFWAWDSTILLDRVCSAAHRALHVAFLLPLLCSLLTC